jgi:hypothetical protein
MCLFSKLVLSTSALHSLSGDRLTIPSLPQHSSLAIYELESITRLSLALADPIGLVATSYKTRDKAIPIRVNFDVPDVGYYWTVCELFNQGLVKRQYVDCCLIP